MDEERRDYAVLISLAMREEAEVVAGALRADGIDAFVGNAHHANVDWLYTLALGGLQVLVPRQKLGDARTALRERIRENADAHPEDKVRRRDHWKVWLLFGGFYGGGWLLALMLSWLLAPYNEDLPVTEWINTPASMPAWRD